MDNSIKLSIAIITRNRIESLRNTLESIKVQTIQPLEVVVSDDSDGLLASEVKELVLQYGFRYITGPKKGLHANRNHAARHCRGTHIRSMDDDHRFLSDHLEKCLTCLEEDPSAIWILGEYWPENIDHDLKNIASPGELNRNGVSSLPVNPQYSRAISCGGSIYPISVIEKKIFYCELFKFGNLHLEYGVRLSHCGYKMRLITKTFIIHDVNINEMSRSFDLRQGEVEEIRLFLALCYSNIYFPNLKNKYNLLVVFVKTLSRGNIFARIQRWNHARRKMKMHWSEIKDQLVDSALYFSSNE